MPRPQLLPALAALAGLAVLGASVGAVLGAPPAAAEPSTDIRFENGEGGTKANATQRGPNPAMYRGTPYSTPDGKDCYVHGGTYMTCDVFSHGAKYSWHNGMQCYVTVAKLPPGHPGWSQRGAGIGVFYGCFTVEEVLRGERAGDRVWWSNTLYGNRPVNAGDWVRTAETFLGYREIDMGIVPEPGPDRAGVLGLPTWMWVSNPTPPTAGVVNAIDVADGLTLRTSATWLGVTWDMGDGTSHQCGRGTPYQDSHGVSASPTCGHMYTRPGTYTVTATSRWRIDYAVDDVLSGSYEVSRATSTDIRIAEVQVLNR